MELIIVLSRKGFTLNLDPVQLRIGSEELPEDASAALSLRELQRRSPWQRPIEAVEVRSFSAITKGHPLEDGARMQRSEGAAPV